MTPAPPDRQRHDGEEGYDRQPLPCRVCDAETRLRCAGCRQPLCHTCDECPDGCDSLRTDRFGE